MKTAKRPDQATGKELVELTGIPLRTLHHLASEGHIPKPKDGRWPRAGTVCALLRHYRKRGKRVEPLFEEKRRLTAAQADAQELRNRELAGDLIPLATMEARVRDLTGHARAFIVACPAIYAARANPADPQTARKALETLRDDYLRTSKEPCAS